MDNFFPAMESLAELSYTIGEFNTLMMQARRLATRHHLEIQVTGETEDVLCVTVRSQNGYKVDAQLHAYRSTRVQLTVEGQRDKFAFWEHDGPGSWSLDGGWPTVCEPFESNPAFQIAKEQIENSAGQKSISSLVRIHHILIKAIAASVNPP